MNAKVYLIFFISTVTSYLYGNDASQNKTNPNKLYSRVLHYYLSNPDSAIFLLDSCISLSLQKPDTTKAIKHLHEKAWFYMNSMKYIDAYTPLRKAVKLSEAYHDSLNLSKSNMLLSSIYSTFGQEQLSAAYMNKALHVYKHLARNYDSLACEELTKCYYKAAINSRHFKNYHDAIKYCDSATALATIINQDTIHTSYFHTEKADLLNKNGKFKESRDILLQTKKVFESIPREKKEERRHLAYLVIIYSALGDAYAGLNHLELSKKYYYLALQHMKDMKAHLGMEPYIHSQLSTIFQKEGNSKDAYETLKLSRNIYDSLFGLRSNQNLGLLEIQNKLEEEIKRKNQEILNNEKLLAQKERILFRGKIIASSIISLVIIFLLIIRIKNQQKLHNKEKENIDRENKLKDDAANRLIEAKNKELTTYTLQFIEKDKTIQTLIDLIKANNSKKVSSFLKTINTNQSLWDEFNYRFNAVNTGFYDRLTEKFPDLSPTEKKYCALIKLNFSGKEMAHLLGISESSVHISRHRLRKKMNLKRDTNLSTFIATI